MNRFKLLFAMVLSVLVFSTGTHAADRDFTCFFFSDIHLGTDHPKSNPPVTPELMLKRMNAHLDEMRKLVGAPFPKKGSLSDIELGSVDTPRGLFILGDLTDGSPDNAKRQEQWKTFLDVFPPAGLPFGAKTVPIYAMLGNHDGELTGPQGQGLVAHHREMAKANRFTTLAENGLHFALNWDGVHFICLNICPADTVDEETLFKYGKPGKGSWNDPQGALTFLKDYLQKNVGNSQQPVFIMHHYGFDGFSLNDWNWWTPKQRRAYYDAIKDYNIVALIHGHNHAAEHYTWPQAKRHAADIKAMFGDAPPEKVREFDVISCGPICWVFRFKGDEFYASHLANPDWNSNPAFHVRKSMKADKPTAPPAPPLPAKIQPAVPILATPLPLSAVRITGGPLKRAQDLDAQYLLKLEPDRMLAYFRMRAGLKPKAKPYGGWDGDNKNLTGHVAGHYLSAVSYMYAATGDEQFKQRADYIISELKEVQARYPDGYLGALAQGREKFAEVARGEIHSGGFDLNGLWSPWYVLHKIYAGLRDAYRLTGNATALELEIGFASWAESILAKLDDAQIQKMLNTEFGGMNEIFADLYADTADKRWLALADKFHHKAIVDPLADHKNILDAKHGNTQVPKLLGSLVRYLHTGEASEGEAAKFFWDEVVAHHTFCTGGHGQDEYFHKPDDFNAHVDGRTAESCNVYNMLKMTRLLFALSPQERYAQFHEQALFNHVLASIDPQDGWTCYMVPVGRAVKREYERNMTDGGFTCCVGTGMENHALHGDGIYYTAPQKLWVNLFIPSTANWESADVTITQETTFPEGDSATIKFNTKQPTPFTLALRRPAWAGEGFTVSLNGQPVPNLPKPGSYVEISRTWTTGDTLSITLPKTLRSAPLPDNPSRMAFMWGPLALAGDLGPEHGEKKDPSKPTSRVPVFVTSDSDVTHWLKPVANETGHFKTANVGHDRDIDFIPFYRLHRRTYGVYWDVYSPQDWEKKSAEYAAEEERLRKLTAATVAFAQPGEMQPERDFNFQGEETRPVRVMERQGRRGSKWFSFDMPVETNHPMMLVITYSSEERTPRSFRILVDGQPLADQKIERSSPSRFFDVDFPLPANLVEGKKKITVRFEANPKSEIATIFGIRVIRADAPR